MKTTNGHALLVIDLQLDFMPEGALAVKDGDKIIPVINKLVKLFSAKEDMIFFSRDWHPEKHCSFFENGGTWPEHCVRGSRGARFHPDVQIPETSKIISKATTESKDAYSAFEDTELAEELEKNNINTLYVCGLATDVCVRSTVLDGLELGLTIIVVSDAVKAVELEPGDGDRAIQEMNAAGAEIVESSMVIGQHNI